MLPSRVYRLVNLARSQGDRRTIKVIPWFESKNIEDGRNYISMGSYLVTGASFGNPWTTDNQRNINIFFITALFAWWQTVLSNVIAIVTSVEYICVVNDTLLLQSLDNSINQFIDRLKSPKSGAVKVIVIIDLGLILSL